MANMIFQTAGATNVSVPMYIFDSTDGTPETGVVATTTGLAFYYWRPGAARVEITGLSNLALQTTAHTDGGILHIGDGHYRVDFQDAAFASGVDYVVLEGTATGMIVKPTIVMLNIANTPSNFSTMSIDGSGRVDVGSWLGTAVTTSSTSAKPEVDTFSVSDDATAANNLELACDNYSATRGLAGTALPAAAADAAGGLPISDAGGLDLDNMVSDALDVVTYAELTNIPAATSTLADKITHIFMHLRNGLAQTATTTTLYQDDGTTAYMTRTVADNGTTFTAAEGADSP